MVLIAHESEEAANHSAALLRSLGTPARKLLAECVEHQGVERTKLSKAANDLEDSGFVFVREIGGFYATGYSIKPSLFGEEALEALEVLQDQEESKIKRERI